MGIEVQSRGMWCARCREVQFDQRALDRQEQDAATALVARGIRTPAEFKFVREAAGFDPKELAHVFDVHHKTVARWERRGAAPPRVVAFALGELFSRPKPTQEKLEMLGSELPTPRRTAKPKPATAKPKPATAKPKPATVKPKAKAKPKRAARA